MKYISLTSLMVVFLWLSACNSTDNKSKKILPNTTLLAKNESSLIAFDYDLSTVERHYTLPDELTDITGIVSLDDTKLLCVQRNKGIVYVYSLVKEKVIDRVKFDKKGNYTDITRVDDFVYAIQDNGRFRRINQFGNKRQSTFLLRTYLDKENGTEGLCYDATQDRLLMICRKEAGLNKALEGRKGVYAFDINQNKFIKQPATLIEFDAILSHLQVADLAKVDSLGKELSFLPSSMTIHPHTQRIYILGSGETPLLVVLNTDYSLHHVELLEETVFGITEGMTFLDNGDLLITNRFADTSVNEQASVLRFKLKQENLYSAN